MAAQMVPLTYGCILMLGEDRVDHRESGDGMWDLCQIVGGGHGSSQRCVITGTRDHFFISDASDHVGPQLDNKTEGMCRTWSRAFFSLMYNDRL